MNPILFYLFGAIAVIAAMMILFFRNPVSSAMSMVVSFVAMAAIYFTLDAQFLGVAQILVYTGAVMVLFLFIIMLMNVKAEEKQPVKPLPLIGTLLVVALFVAQLVLVIGGMPKKEAAPLDLAAAAPRFEEGSQIHSQLAAGNFPDTALIGNTLFSGQYNATFLLIGLILVVATIGVVSLSRRPESQK